MIKNGAGHAPGYSRHWALCGVFALVMTQLLSSCGPGVPTHSASSEVGSVVAGAETTAVPIPITANPKFVRISVEQGLSQSSVYSMLQDSQGYMWFGTEDGLNRYDGYSFRIYRHDPDNPDSLSDNWISSIVEDQTGALWIGTDGGINRYERDSDSFVRYRHDPSDPSSLISDEVSVILEDSSGTLWIGSRGGLSRYDRDRDQFRNYRNEADIAGSGAEDEILALYEDSRGTLWIGTDEAGLTRFDADGTFFNYPLANIGSGPGRNDVRSVFEDRHGRLWVGTEGGLTTFDRETGGFGSPSEMPALSDELRTTEVYSIYGDRDGIIWVGTWGDGVFVIDPEGGELYNYRQTAGNDRSLNHNMAVSLLQDREGTLWIGTTTGGVNKLTIDNRTFAYYQHDPNNENSLSSDWVRSIFEDDGGFLWITTGGGGLNRYSRETETWRRFVHDPADPSSLGDDFLSRVSQDSRGNLWIATESGVDLFDPATETFTHFRDSATSSADALDTNRTRNVYEDGTGRLWVARAGGGVAEMNPDDGTFTAHIHDPDDPNSLIYDKVWQISGDSRGELWFSTSLGVDRFDPETETFTHFQSDPNDPRSLSDHFVMGVWEDRFGTMWICSFGGGLNRFEPETETFVHWTEKDGLSNSVVYAIAFDDSDRLWISTNNGLSRFDPASETFTNFQLKDGLPIVEFNADAVTQTRSGEVFFGGINGFVSFFPSSVRKNPFVPPLVITRFISGDEPVQILDDAAEITIRWPVDSFEFEYASLSYSNPEYNQHAYMLEGLDDDWIRAGTSRVGRYDRLQGGSYTLRIQGSNDDGLWNESGTSLRITVVPPFWATWWFRIIAVALIIGAVAALVGLRIRSMAVRNRRLESEVKERTAAQQHEATQRQAAEESLHRVEMEKAVAEERGRLARELHDSVTQSLYSLTLFTEATCELAEAGELDQVKHGLVRSADTALQALKEMRLLVYELRPLALSETSLIEAIRHRLDAVETRSGVKTHMQIEGDAETQLPEEVEEAVFRIAQEALNNALKHAHATEITVRFRLPSQNGRLELEITDNGVGFDNVTGKHGGLGLSGIQERAQRISAAATIETAPGDGTCVRLIMESK